MIREIVLIEQSSDATHAQIAALAREFPWLVVRSVASGEPHIQTSQWCRDEFDTWTFDCVVDDLSGRDEALWVSSDSVAVEAISQIVTRCQRHLGHRNADSSDGLFSRLLAAHRALHDLSKPLVRADYNHALDVWQWLLRLDARVSRELQLAALFHDVERLASEADRRVEQNAADYQEFKDEHARRGAVMTQEVLRAAGESERVCRRAGELISAHERKSDDNAIALLNDADALSFFSLNSNGYADYFGPEQTLKKVAYTWKRMSAAARTRLRGVRLRSDVAAALHSVQSH